ncbi:N-acetylmuramoyl-L-alanine amidase [Clostridium sp.]|uniref:N-acetylmuramoyl-L-alanine amidase family protein n=1 Tax=Clostridium sp. TaxID=1506 RepID=UPI002FCB33DD
MKKRFKVLNLLLAIIFLFSIYPTVKVFAAEEDGKELLKVIKEYKDYNIVVKEGLLLDKGEKASLGEFLNENKENLHNVKWKTSKSGILTLTQQGDITGVSHGTTIVSAEIDKNVFLFEVFVNDADKMKAARRITDLNSTEKISVTTLSSNSYKVFIDPGHGGADPGAISTDRTLRESDVNLRMAKVLEEKLKSQGIQVKMSRYDDTYVSLEGRADMANKWGATLFVSIHQNSFSSDTANGIETLYYKDNIGASFNLATKVQNKMIQATGLRDRGTKSPSIYVLKATNMPAILTESGFITNPVEFEKMKTDEYINTIALSIYAGIDEYLKSAPVNNGPVDGNTGNNDNINMYFTKNLEGGVQGTNTRRFNSPMIKDSYRNGSFKATVEVKKQDGSIEKIDRIVKIRKN